MTDYPDTALVDNLAYNVERNIDSTARPHADVQVRLDITNKFAWSER